MKKVAIYAILAIIVIGCLYLTFGFPSWSWIFAVIEAITGFAVGCLYIRKDMIEESNAHAAVVNEYIRIIKDHEKTENSYVKEINTLSKELKDAERKNIELKSTVETLKKESIKVKPKKEEKKETNKETNKKTSKTKK